MIKIILVAFIGVIVSVLLKRTCSDINFSVAIITGVIIFGLLYTDINNILNVFKAFSYGYGVSEVHIKLLIKVMGISYITQFGVSVAEECGEKFIAKKIDIAGRILIISMSVPMLINLLDSIINLL